MRKIFRLANAEFSKTFYRPSVFILTGLLILTLVITNLLYSPKITSTKLSYNITVGGNVGDVYSSFTGTGEKINKNTIDKEFVDAYNKVVEQYESITHEDKKAVITDQTLSLNEYLTNNNSGILRAEILYLSNTTDSMFSVNVQKTKKVFDDLKKNCSALLDLMARYKNETLNFYFKISDYKNMHDEVEKLYNAVPNDLSDYTRQNYIDLGNTIISSFSLTQSLKIISGLEKFELNYDDYTKLKSEYYTEAVKKLNDVYLKQITDFYESNSESTESEDLDLISDYVARYYSYANMNKTILQNKFLLSRIGNKSDTELVNLLGYDKESKYALNETIQKYNYLITNEQFDFNYLSSFNYNYASGTTQNAYDYTVYTMQILSILITIFAIFFACSSIAGDQSSGTMKMIAIRPYTRNKLFAGKYLSCVLFGVMLIVISSIASFVVGIASFGAPMLNCLIVFNASTVIAINPYLLLLIYLVSNIINLLFYISLAMFVCLCFRSNSLSVFIAAAIYGIQIVLSGLVSSVGLKYTPLGHFDLFRYFTFTKSGFLSFNILPDSSFAISALVIFSGIVLMNILSHLIFKHRDIA